MGFIIEILLIFFCVAFLSESVRASHMLHDFVDPNRSSFAVGQYRTGYHFQPHNNWMNDPNGPMYYKGVYHLFYQYNPKGAVWGNIVWAHSVSTDMLNWISLQPALYPSKSFDIGGCWSGSATILTGNKPVILYTGIGSNKHQLQNIAVPKDLFDPFLHEWIKPDYNPIINPGPGINASAFRDPSTAWLGSDGQWRLVVGTHKWGRKRGVAVLYKSKDFVNWVEAKHPLHSVAGSGMWECPDFFPVAIGGTKGMDTSEIREGVKYVFKISLDLMRFDYYTVGRYDIEHDRYVPDEGSIDNKTGLRYDYGNFYGSKSFFDPAKNRRILWGWSNESDTEHDDTAKAWAGIQTIPRSILLDTNGRQLVQWPIKELDNLRGKKAHVTNMILNIDSVVQVQGIQTSEADVEVTFMLPSLEKAQSFDPTWTDPQVLCDLMGAEVPGGVGPFGLFVLASGRREERTAVFFRVFKAPNKHVILMCHDSSKSSFRHEVWKQSFGGFVDFDIEKEKKISLRSLIDNSVVESFGAEGRTCITSRVYPTLAIGEGANLFAFNGGLQDVRIENLTAWEITRPQMNGV